MGERTLFRLWMVKYMHREGRLGQASVDSMPLTLLVVVGGGLMLTCFVWLAQKAAYYRLRVSPSIRSFDISDSQIWIRWRYVLWMY